MRRAYEREQEAAAAAAADTQVAPPDYGDGEQGHTIWSTVTGRSMAFDTAVDTQVTAPTVAEDSDVEDRPRMVSDEEIARMLASGEAVEGWDGLMMRVNLPDSSTHSAPHEPPQLDEDDSPAAHFQAIHPEMYAAFRINDVEDSSTHSAPHALRRSGKGGKPMGSGGKLF